MSGQEFYSLVDGKKQDAHLHEDMLASPDAASIEKRVKEAIAFGMTEEMARRIFPLDTSSPSPES